MNSEYHRRPRYTPRPSKALEAILWLATRQRGIDVYHIVKAAYFADKYHVNAYGRPIIGDDYQAAPFGPLPQVIYGLLKHDPIEMLALQTNGHLPFTVTPSYEVIPDRDANANILSVSDLEALTLGLDTVKDLTFDELFEITHADPAYINADGGMMDYRDFLDLDDPDRDEKAADLSENARYAIL